MCLICGGIGSWTECGWGGGLCSRGFIIRGLLSLRSKSSIISYWCTLNRKLFLSGGFKYHEAYNPSHVFGAAALRFSCLFRCTRLLGCHPNSFQSAMCIQAHSHHTKRINMRLTLRLNLLVSIPNTIVATSVAIETTFPAQDCIWGSLYHFPCGVDAGLSELFRDLCCWRGEGWWIILGLGRRARSCW